ncbi:MAG: GerAB/ArcD/ProY family transporter [Bacillota bacterium]
MEKAKVSAIQLFAIMFIYDLGTALVIPYGIAARKDAWLADLLGMCGGIILFYIHFFLFRQFPNLPLTGYVRKIFGKYMGWIFGLSYVMYFLYIAARNVRDFGDLIISSTLSETPLLAISISLVLVVCYVLYLGIEVAGRTGEIFLIILILFGIAGNFFVLVSGSVDLHNLQPFLENGWKPILTTIFPETINFPFGEAIVFTMFFPYLNQPGSLKKVGLFSLLSSGIILAWTASLNIAVLSVEEVERSTFPLLSTIGKVNLLEFIQRLDAIVVLSFLLTIFFKVSVLLYGAVIGIADLFNVKNYRHILLPTGCILIFWSMMIASNFSEHIEEGTFIGHSFHIIFYMILPLLMLVVSLIRNRFKNKAN